MVNLCVKVLEFALQSGHTVFKGFSLPYKMGGLICSNFSCIIHVAMLLYLHTDNLILESLKRKKKYKSETLKINQFQF